MASTDFTYSMPYRPNYEAYSFWAWMASIPVALVTMKSTALPALPFYVFCFMAVVMGGSQLQEAFYLWRRMRSLKGRSLTFYKPKDLVKILNKNPNKLWLGKGYEWTPKHTQLTYELLKRDINQIIPKKYNTDDGARWIHGLETETPEMDILLDCERATLMTLIVGTTGSGKTRFFETAITSCVQRGYSVIILDPKGDKDMAETARRACVNAGDEDRFVYFHPAFPEKSARIDPLYNYNQPTEIASRVAAVLPDSGDSGPFKAFGFLAINNIVQGLILSGERPNLVKIRRYLEGGAEGLVIRSISAYCDHFMPGWETHAESMLKGQGTQEKKARAMVRFYNEIVKPKYPNSEIEGLVSMFLHDSAHFSKMIASTLPIMNMLTSSDMGELLSPGDNVEDVRIKTDTSKVINEGQVLYMGFDALSNPIVGGAIGTIFLADLASVAGARYNFGVNSERPVAIFVDEASEMLCDSLIQLLNKGRGSGTSLFVATQTMADFAAKLGDEDKAKMMLGNLNNLVALRTIDNDTQAYITDNLPKTRINYLMRTQGNNSEVGGLMVHGGNVGERLMEEETEMFPPQLLGKLPNLEYIARLAGGRIYKGRIPILQSENDK